MSKETHPFAVLRGHQGDVQALTFDHSENYLISGDAHGEVRVWSLDDLRPRCIRRLHPASAGIINLKLWQTDTTASKNTSDAGGDNNRSSCLVLVTQGRDGTTHMWELDNELNIVEGPPIRSFVREAFSFCRFSLLAADVDDQTVAGQTSTDTTVAAAASVALLAKQSQEAFIEAVLAGDDAVPTTSIENTSEDVEIKENKESINEKNNLASVEKKNAIEAIHTCCSSSSPSKEQNTIKHHPAAIIAIPSHSEKIIEVCCGTCGTPLAVFLQNESEAAALPEQDSWGMCMATKLFIGPKEVNNDILLAVGYESGHVVLWSVTAAVAAAATATATAAAGSSGFSPVQYTPPKPLGFAKLHSEPIMALDIDRNGYSGVSGSAEDTLIAFSITYHLDGKTAKLLPAATINLKKQGVADVAVRSDGKLIASAGWDGKIRMYKKSNGKALAVFQYHSAAASAVAFSPKTFLTASGARDGTVALWDIYSSEKK